MDSGGRRRKYSRSRSCCCFLRLAARPYPQRPRPLESYKTCPNRPDSPRLSGHAISRTSSQSAAMSGLFDLITLKFPAQHPKTPSTSIEMYRRLRRGGASRIGSFQSHQFVTVERGPMYISDIMQLHIGLHCAALTFNATVNLFPTSA